ncbi:hypothetical protein M758_4G147300 [Ceratodon purpureus]|nr:hypothetical protein M758_4G147300 [Ceratodon purpureus]
MIEIREDFGDKLRGTIVNSCSAISNLTAASYTDVLVSFTFAERLSGLGSSGSDIPRFEFTQGKSNWSSTAKSASSISLEFGAELSSSGS